ncbi:MAG: KEOPS complex N(6)-L-threonylcarbamoyladenine synthase Kae1 [Candidatus Woesearchaeota archaeon]
MIILGIESTAHTFGVSVFKDGEILSNIKKNFTTTKGGMIPAKVADHHVDNCAKVFEEAILVSKIKKEEIDKIAYSASPGIGHMLRIGAVFARVLSLKLNKPLVPINHCIAHLEVGRFYSGFEDPILLYVSGANTQVIAYEANKYRVFGETLDIGIGNFLDSMGRTMKLGFPAGPKIEQLAKSGSYIKLPYVVKGMDVSFGGLLTNVKQKLRQGEKIEDLCYSVQETIFAMIVEVTERAIAHTGKKQVVLGGGVACNKRLQEMLKEMCKQRNIEYFCPEPQFLVDNAAMIAIAASFTNETLSVEESYIDPYLRTDEVKITYRN